MSLKTMHLANCWHRESGGIATFYRELLRAAARRERQIRLVVPGASNRVEECGPFARIYHVEGRPSRLSPGYRLLLPHQYLLPRSPLRDIMAAERPDVVECCDRYTLNYLAGFLRCGWLIRGYRPSVVGLQCERMDDTVATYVTRHPAARNFCRAYLRWLQFPLFDHHIAVSDYVARELREVAQGHDVRRGVWVMPHGVASGHFHPQRRSPELRARLESRCGAPEGSTLLLYVGRLAPEKNLELLIDTVALLEDSSAGAFHLVVGGEGPLRAHLERDCARRIPGAACFLGHIGDRQQLAEVYANCDVFVHPNPREPFGIAPLEAMSSGLALVAPRSSRVPIYADESNAWLADATPEAFAQAIREVRRDPALRAARQSAARATAEGFDWQHVADRYFALYDELHALVRDGCREPAIAPAFYSTAARSAVP
jgi:alpha-1,6-mannosyltransferase